MPSIEQHTKDLTEAVYILIHTIKHQGAQMVDAVADMTAAVTGALDEISTLVAAVVATPKDNTAAIEDLAAKLTKATADAKAALAPAPVSPVAPVVDPAPAP